MQHAGIGTRGREPRYQGVFKHIAGTPGIFADDHFAAVRFGGIILSDKAADLIGVFRRQVYVGFAAESVCSKIFSHGNCPFRIARHPPELFLSVCKDYEFACDKIQNNDKNV